MTTPTPLPLDDAALDWLHDNHAHDFLGNFPQVIAQSRAALTLAARVAELERELAEDSALRTRMGDILTLTVNALKGEPDSRSLHDWATLPDVARSLVAHANALRDALEKGNRRLGYWCDLHGSLPEDVAALGAMQAALASTPAASLAAYRKSVLEEAAKVCDEREEIYQGESEACESNGEEADHFESLRDECAGLAAAIRALAAQAQEVK